MSLIDTLTPYVTEEEIRELVMILARKVEQDYAGQAVSLICPLKGSVFFIADFMRELKLQQEVDFVYLSNRSSKGARGGDIKFIKDVGTDLAGKHVIIVEEIIDTARTLSFLKNRTLSFFGMLSEEPCMFQRVRFISQAITVPSANR